MRRLILMRHAKSSWDDPGLADEGRPLAKRGRKSATRIGKWLRDEGYRPDHALVSTALRTRETWDIVSEKAGGAPLTVKRALYHATPDAMLAALKAAPDAASLLMLGHQPGIGPFARALLAEPPDDADFAKFPTAAVAIIDFPVDHWSEADWGRGHLGAFQVPRALE